MHVSICSMTHSPPTLDFAAPGGGDSGLAPRPTTTTALYPNPFNTTANEYL